MSLPHQASLQNLFQEGPRIRRLARSLLSDPSLVDDVVQDTLATSLSRPPRNEQAIRAWISKVVRNFAAQNQRSESARNARQEDASRPEAGEATQEIVERAATHKLVVEAVLGLREPYRSTILMRYFDELSPSSISKRLGIPLPTVESRLSRGLAQLREQMQRHFGQAGRAWQPALILLAREPRDLISTAIGALVVTTQVKVISASIAAIVISLAAWQWVDSSNPATPVNNTAPNIEIASNAPPELQSDLWPPAAGEVEQSSSERQQVAPQQKPAKVLEPKAVETFVDTIQGRVVDQSNQALPRVRVHYRPKELPDWAAALTGTAMTDESGHFEISRRMALGGNLEVSDPDWVTVIRSQIDSNKQLEDEYLIIAAPKHSVTGIVVGENGSSIPEAVIRLSPPGDFRSRFDVLLDYYNDETWQAVTGADGRFQFAQAPQINGARLTVDAAGYESAELELPPHANPDIAITLTRPESKTLAGQVLDHEGKTVAGAQVSLGDRITQTNGRGEFRMELARINYGGRDSQPEAQISSEDLLAIKEGFRAGVARAPSFDAENRPIWPSFVTLQLPGPPLTIRGKVKKPSGKVARGVKVWVQDPTLFARNGVLQNQSGAPLLVEDISAGGKGSEDRTNFFGNFKLEGLGDRTYTVCALDLDTFLRTEIEGVQAGTEGLLIQLPEDGLLERVAGRVLDSAGTPLPGITVATAAVTFDAFGQVNQSANSGVVTDESGYFEITGVPKRSAFLLLSGETIMPSSFGGPHLEELEQDLLNLEITVLSRCHFLVSLQEKAQADAFSVLDESGAELLISSFRGSTITNTNRAKLSSDGRSDSVAVPETARTLVLYRDNQEVNRTPMSLRPGILNELNP